MIGSSFSSLTFGSTTLTRGWYSDVFVVKYDADGNVLWATQGKSGSGDYDYGNGITIDVNGNIYITGTCGANTVFDSWITGIAGIYIIEYNSSGNIQRMELPKGNGGGVGSGITSDKNGNVYITGWFTGPSITFGGDTATNAKPGNSDILLVALNPTLGQPSSIWSVGGANDDQGYGITTDVSGNIYVMGYFQSSSITFGTDLHSRH